MPIGTAVNEDVKLVGYFFKLQGYHSQQQEMDKNRTGKEQAVLRAPVIIGRAVWIVSPLTPEYNTPVWVLATLAGVAVVVVVGWVLLAARRSVRHYVRSVVPGGSLDPEPPEVDSWLDQAQSGRLTLEPVPETTACSEGAALDGFGVRRSGNILWGNDESSNGHRASNGRADDATALKPQPAIILDDSKPQPAGPEGSEPKAAVKADDKKSDQAKPDEKKPDDRKPDEKKPDAGAETKVIAPPTAVTPAVGKPQ